MYHMAPSGPWSSVDAVPVTATATPGYRRYMIRLETNDLPGPGWSGTPRTDVRHERPVTEEARSFTPKVSNFGCRTLTDPSGIAQPAARVVRMLTTRRRLARRRCVARAGIDRQCHASLPFCKSPTAC